MQRGGYYAIESLRLERATARSAANSPRVTIRSQAGLLFTCKLASPIDFLGRAAVAAARAEGPRRRLVGFAVDSAEPMLWGGELIRRDGAVAGQVTSAAWGASTGRCVGLGYLRAADDSVISPAWVREGGYTVDVGGAVYPIAMSLKAIYDPGNERIR